MSSTL